MLDSHPIPCIKINSEWIKNINIRARSIKLLDENIVVNLSELEWDNGFLDITGKPVTIKGKINK